MFSFHVGYRSLGTRLAIDLAVFHMDYVYNSTYVVAQNTVSAVAVIYNLATSLWYSNHDIVVVAVNKINTVIIMHCCRLTTEFGSATNAPISVVCSKSLVTFSSCMAIVTSSFDGIAYCHVTMCLGKSYKADWLLCSCDSVITFTPYS